MKALVAHDGRLIWADKPHPLPSNKQVLIEVAAAGLNVADISRLKAHKKSQRDSSSDILGVDVSGTVLITGSGVTSLAAGDRVMALASEGSFCETTLVEEDLAIKIPRSVSLLEAGGFMQAFLAAFDALCIATTLSEDQSLLITGSAGSVGTAAIQLARMVNAHIVASTRHPNFKNRLKALGANVVCFQGEEAVHKPFNVVLDTLGGSHTAALMKMLAPFGVQINLGTPETRQVRIDLAELIAKCGTLRGRSFETRPFSRETHLIKTFRERVVSAFVTGRLIVPIHAVFSMEEAENAFEMFLRGKKFGKIILKNPDYRE